MMRNKFVYIFFLCALLSGSAFRVVSASSYDLYVDESCDEDDADGSKDNPFCEIEDAIDEADEGDEIYIYDGEYSGGFELEDGMSLFGESDDDTIIKGAIEMEDGSSINSLTVTGASINIEVKEDADVEINNCRIINAKKVGIQTEVGGGKITVEDSKIRDNGKGFYIQAGKSIELNNNEVYDNSEEGIDIRANVSGSITNNSIYDNDESGIELIVGKSEISIKSNSIKNNGASGIANQFYADWSKEGDIKISSNTISGNDKYGVDCNIPSGGGDKMVSGYWKDSLDLRKNKIEKNDKGSISDTCALIEVVKEEEKNDNETVEISEADRKTALQQSASVETEEEEELSEADKKIEERLDVISTEFSEGKQSIESLVEGMNDENSWKVFFVGYSPKEQREINAFYEKINGFIEELDGYFESTGNPEIQEKITALKEDLTSELSVMESVKTQIGDVFSLFGWIRKPISDWFAK